MFRVAVSGRREQEVSFFTVVVWRDQAEHAAQSLSKGSRVVVVGRLQQRSWTAEDAAPAPSWRSSATTWRRSATRPATRSRPGSPTRSPRWSSASGSGPRRS
ncbi:MAG: single-stranded DNA-binding protein [Actinomycetota bacterium]